jgi:hypothetical protein
MSRSFTCLIFLLTLLSTEVFAQNNIYPFCNAGLHPDGYIDFSDLPLAPNFPGPVNKAATGPSTSFTTTLPVHGVAGLTVQLTIPSLKSVSGGSGPLYTVINGTLVLNGAPPTGELVLLQFSNAVAGVGLTAGSPGRASTYLLQINPESTGTLPLSFQNSSSTHTTESNFFSTPLAAVALSGGSFQSASVGYLGDEYANPSLADLRVQSTAASSIDIVPKEGLEQWLISESVGDSAFGTASSWPDQSGQGHRASQANAAYQPAQVAADGNTCFGAFSFSGKQYFNFNLPIDGWQQMTVFLVAKASVNPAAGSLPSQASAIFWIANANGGNTYVSPYQNNVPFSFGTTQAGNAPVYTRPLTIGQDFTITRAVHDGATDSLYVNGLLALTQSGKLPVLSGTTGAGYIGRGLNGSYFNGEISEILVYNRVLTADETASVESYLRNKFGTR